MIRWQSGMRSASLPGSDNSDIFDHMALAVAGMLKAQMYEKGCVRCQVHEGKDRVTGFY